MEWGVIITLMCFDQTLMPSDQLALSMHVMTFTHACIYNSNNEQLVEMAYPFLLIHSLLLTINCWDHLFYNKCMSDAPLYKNYVVSCSAGSCARQTSCTVLHVRMCDHICAV